FATQDYPGPYCNCEKGLLILYQLLKRCSVEQMSRFIPRGSFYNIYRSFYTKQSSNVDEMDDGSGNCLFEMERSACPLFGVVTNGVHMIIYEGDVKDTKIWVPRRAKTKQTCVHLS